MYKQKESDSGVRISVKEEQEEGGRPLQQHSERARMGQQVVVVFADVEGDLGTSPVSPHFGPSPVSVGTQSPSPPHMASQTPVTITVQEPSASQSTGDERFELSVQPIFCSVMAYVKRTRT